MERFDAACAGVHLHGLAGEIAGEKLAAMRSLARSLTRSPSIADTEGKRICAGTRLCDRSHSELQPVHSDRLIRSLLQ